MTQLADRVRFRLNLSRYMIIAGLTVFLVTGGPYYALLCPPLAAPAVGEVAGYRWYGDEHAAGPVEVSIIRYADASGSWQQVERVGHFAAAVPLHYSRWQAGLIALDDAASGPGPFVFLIGVALAGAGISLAASSVWRMHAYRRDLRRVLRR
jgi:hypothetical protein